ncbi:MAG: molybdopterin-dependent oxidoreductase [Desulfovibrionales bacterium]
MRPHEIVTSCTRDCPGGCGILAAVKDGSPVRLRGNPDHPVNRGVICKKTRRYLDRALHPDRVLHPLRRVRGQWQRTTWEEALDEIAQRLQEYATSFGNESILHYQGYGERTALKLLNSWFFALLGGVTTLKGTLCSGTGQAAQNLDFGTRISHDPLDLSNSRSIILWGRNPAATQVPMIPMLRRARKHGARILCIDPRTSETARESDLHIRPAPGTDLWLALAAAREILNRKMEDQSFCRNNAEGFEAYRALLQGLDSDRLAGECDVSRNDVQLLADTMLDRPAAILLGWGLHRWTRAHLTVRAIDGLSGLSGNVGLPGGGVSQGFDEFGPYDPSWWGTHLHPPRRKLLMGRIGREILDADPPIKMALITAANPVCMAPNSRLVAQALDRTEFVVLAGHFLDDTADHADIFLPCTTFLEQRDVVASYGHNYVGPVNRVMDPPGQCRSQFHIFQDLAQRFPFGSEFQGDEDFWLKRICAPLLSHGIAFESLMAGPVRIPDAPMVPYADKRFPTPSGKFRFLDTLGPDPVPTPDPSYPFALLSVGAMNFLCSERTLEDHPPLPEIFLHPDHFPGLGIHPFAPVLVISPGAVLEAAAIPDHSVRRDTVVCHRGGWLKAGHGINRLVLDRVSRLGDGTPYYETFVRIERINA